MRKIQTGYVLAAEESAPYLTVTIPAQSAEKVFEFDTENDWVSELGGWVSVELQLDDNSKPTYRILRQNFSDYIAFVTVVDDDALSNLPEISLSTNNHSMIEGETATITLTSDQIAPVGGLLVNYEISQVGDFYLPLICQEPIQ